jgi:quinol monooxygenase YgiN
MGLGEPKEAREERSPTPRSVPNMLIIAGTLRVDAADRAAYLELAARATTMARAASGCLDFAQSPDPLDSSRINIFERWESAADLQAFRDLPADEASLSLPPVLSADVHRYVIAAVEDA